MDGSSSVTTTVEPRRFGRRMDRVAREPRLAPKATPRAFSWYAPAERWWLEAYGLTEMDRLFALAAEELPHAHSYSVSRLAHPMAVSGQQALVLKCEPRVRMQDRLASGALLGAFYGCVRREFELIRRMLAAGIECPRPLVCLERGLLTARACLLLDDIAEATPLNVFLAARRLVDAQMGRDQFFATLGRSVARLHCAGFVHSELHALNVIVRSDPSGWHFAFRNLTHGRVSAATALRGRTRDLALLMATLADRLVSQHDRQCLLDTYVAESRLEPCASQFLQSLYRRIEQLLSHRWIWEIRDSDTAEHETGRRASSAQQTSLWIDPDYRAQLERVGLASFDGMMTTSRGKRLRALKDRENWRIDLDPGSGRSGAYLKKHRIRTLASRIQAKLGRGPGETAGRIEARNIAELNRAGIAAMRLIAFGERLCRDGRLESFVLTEELAGYTQLDQFIKQRFAPTSARRSGLQVEQMRALIFDIADLAAKFHRIGYNHRDLYCCHFFINEPAPGRFKVNLIDLQRVEFRRGMRRRWIVKDLAQLAYSAPRDYVTCTQRLAFVKRYLGVEKLGPREKRLIRQVLAKQKLMEWQLGKHP